MDPDGLNFPPKPEEPLASDCCGNGCTPCVLDIYQEELAMWEAECVRIRNGELPEQDDENISEFSGLQKMEYNGFTIRAITQTTHNSHRVRFDLPKSQSFGLSVGQHVILRAISSTGSHITRQYTPISPVQTKSYVEFILKVYPSGQMSNKISLWQVGDKVEMRGPVGTFKYTPNKYRKVLMLCAGTGIAPMCQVTHAILDNDEDETLIRLAYACKNYNEVLLKPEFQEWRRYWNFSSVFILSQEPHDPDYSYSYGEEVINGHIDESFILNELGDHVKNTKVLICGTPSFESDMLKVVKKLGVPEESIHKF